MAEGEGATPRRVALWSTNWNKDRFTLEIEFGGSRAITLSVDAEDGPCVTLWYGSGEHSFIREDGWSGESREGFAEWCAEIVEDPLDTAKLLADVNANPAYRAEEWSGYIRSLKSDAAVDAVLAALQTLLEGKARS